VNAVGEKCSQEAGAFLGECAKIIEKRFKLIGNCEIIKLSEQRWTVSYGIWPKGNRMPQNRNWRMQAGVDICQDRAEIIPWIWAQGKAEAERRMMEEFKETNPLTSSEARLDSGTVSLEQIVIPIEAAEGFELPGEELLHRVEAAFESVAQPRFENVYLFAKTYKGK
jgi:hypothetical protein